MSDIFDDHPAGEHMRQGYSEGETYQDPATWEHGDLPDPDAQAAMLLLQEWRRRRPGQVNEAEGLVLQLSAKLFPDFSEMQAKAATQSVLYALAFFAKVQQAEEDKQPGF